MDIQFSTKNLRNHQSHLLCYSMAACNYPNQAPKQGTYPLVNERSYGESPIQIN